MNNLEKLAELGQSVWIDDIHRSFIQSGELESLIAEGLRGITSNPTIFEKAITESTLYDEDIRKLAREGKTDIEIYEALATDDIARAADLLRHIHDKTRGRDGYVSLEANPRLAYDAKGTLFEVRRLWRLLSRPNVMIKVPATADGIAAFEQLTAEGININVTLIFSVGQYEAVAGAYIGGVEKLASSGGPISKVASVASLFVSRIDTAVDKTLEEKGISDLQGKIAIADAKAAYSRFQQIFASPRWAKLEALGARRQRPLWGSTGTKNPRYSDVLYVDSLIGPETVNTLPPATLDAFRDHGFVTRTLTAGLDEARGQLDRLAELGIRLEEVCRKLQDDGVRAFAKSFEGLLLRISEKRKNL